MRKANSIDADSKDHCKVIWNRELLWDRNEELPNVT